MLAVATNGHNIELMEYCCTKGGWKSSSSSRLAYNCVRGWTNKSYCLPVLKWLEAKGGVVFDQKVLENSIPFVPCEVVEYLMDHHRIPYSPELFLIAANNGRCDLMKFFHSRSYSWDPIQTLLKCFESTAHVREAHWIVRNSNLELKAEDHSMLTRSNISDKYMKAFYARYGVTLKFDVEYIDD